MKTTSSFILTLATFACICSWQSNVYAQRTDIEKRLSTAPVQEKAYLHLDNNCYFLGDTIWYKAYLVEAGTCDRRRIAAFSMWNWWILKDMS